MFHSIRSQDTVYCFITTIQLAWLPTCFTNNHQIYAEISSNVVQLFSEFWNNHHTISSYQEITRRINVELLESIRFIAINFHSHGPKKRAFNVRHWRRYFSNNDLKQASNENGSWMLLVLCDRTFNGTRVTASAAAVDVSTMSTGRLLHKLHTLHAYPERHPVVQCTIHMQLVIRV